MRKILFLLPCFFLLSFGQSVMSQETEAPTPTAAEEYFDKFVTENKLFQSQLTLKAERIFRLTYPECEEAVKLGRSKPSVLVAPVQRNALARSINPEIDLDGVPAFGQWIEHVNVQGCGQQALVNYLAVAYEMDLPVLLPIVNGQTLLDPIDQPFAEAAISDRLKKMPQPCDSQLFVLDTMPAGFRDKTGKMIVTENEGYGWFEEWAIRACGHVHNAVIVVLPDPRTRFRYIARLR